MKYIRTTNQWPGEMINQLLTKWGGMVIERPFQSTLHFDSSEGQGKVMCSYPKGMLSYFEYDICLNEDTMIYVDTSPYRPFYFLTCPRGVVQIKLEPGTNVKLGKGYDPSFMTKSIMSKEIIFFKNTPTRLSMIRVSDKSYIPDIVHHLDQLCSDENDLNEEEQIENESGFKLIP